MKELESQLDDLQGRHNILSSSYTSLQAEYMSVKTELERLSKNPENPKAALSSEARSSPGTHDRPNEEVLNSTAFESGDAGHGQAMFDIIEFSFD